MVIRLVRHAHAGRRDGWTGPDEERPLSDRGWAQAQGLADRLGARPMVILSSPYLRCLQTVEPLAARHDVVVEATPLLAEGAPFEPVLELLGRVPDGSVLCSHGDVIPEVIAALDRRGMRTMSAPDWRKGATWILYRVGIGPDASITAARTEPPPR